MNNINDYVSENGELTSEFYNTISEMKGENINNLNTIIDSLLQSVSVLNKWVLEYRDLAKRLQEENEELKELLDEYEEEALERNRCSDPLIKNENDKEESLDDLIKLFTSPDYAKLNEIHTGDCVTPSVSNKKPVNQCILINGKLAVYEDQIKDFLEKSGIKFISNDTFNSVAKELLGF